MYPPHADKVREHGQKVRDAVQAIRQAADQAVADHVDKLTAQREPSGQPEQKGKR